MLCMYHLVVIWYSKKICTWLAVNTVLKSVLYFTLMWNNNRKRKSVYIIKTLENLCIEQIHMNINMTLSKSNFGQNVQWHLYKCLKTNKRNILHFEKALDSSTSFYLHTVCAANVSKVFAQVFHYKKKKKNTTQFIRLKWNISGIHLTTRDVTFLNNITV